MDNQIILLETIRSLSAGISKQEQHFHMDQLINPILPDINVNGDPMGINVPGNPPETLTYFVLHPIKLSMLFQKASRN